MFEIIPLRFVAVSAAVSVEIAAVT